MIFSLWLNAYCHHKTGRIFLLCSIHIASIQGKDFGELTKVLYTHRVKLRSAQEEVFVVLFSNTTIVHWGLAVKVMPKTVII